MSKGWLIGIISIIILAAFIAWVFIESSKPLPGQKFSDLGRKHVTIEVKYNSNPPTSGDHYADWIRAGVYDIPRDDRNLVHSLEHGYVIMHYRCLEGQVQSEASQSAEQDNQCEERKNQLTKIYEKKGKRKLIVVPRENLDTNFALTAWTYLDKFEGFDEERFSKFIDAHRDQGPEKTKE